MAEPLDHPVKVMHASLKDSEPTPTNAFLKFLKKKSLLHVARIVVVSVQVTLKKPLRHLTTAASKDLETARTCSRVLQLNHYFRLYTNTDNQ